MFEFEDLDFRYDLEGYSTCNWIPLGTCWSVCLAKGDSQPSA